MPGSLADPVPVAPGSVQIGEPHHGRQVALVQAYRFLVDFPGLFGFARGLVDAPQLIPGGGVFRMNAHGLLQAAPRGLPLLLPDGGPRLLQSLPSRGRGIDAGSAHRHAFAVLLPHQADRPGVEVAHRVVAGDDDGIRVVAVEQHVQAAVDVDAELDAVAPRAGHRLRAHGGEMDAEVAARLQTDLPFRLAGAADQHRRVRRRRAAVFDNDLAFDEDRVPVDVAPQHSPGPASADRGAVAVHARRLRLRRLRGRRDPQQARQRKREESRSTPSGSHCRRLHRHLHHGSGGGPYQQEARRESAPGRRLSDFTAARRGRRRG